MVSQAELAIEPLYPLGSATVVPVPLRTRAPAAGLEYAHAELGSVVAALRVDRGLGLASAWVRLDLRQRCVANVPTHDAGVWIGSRSDAVALADAAPPGGLFIDAGAAAGELWAATQGVLVRGVLAHPHGALVCGGGLGVSPSEVWAALRGACTRDDAAPYLALASGTPYHDAGATAVQELGLTLATVLELLREGGDAVWPRLVVQLCVDAEVLVSTAKLRAARWLLGGIGRRRGLAGLPPCSVRTAWRNRTRHDEWNNLVRATLETFAGTIGGADEIIAQPHTQARGDASDDARRWALGVAHVLLAESGTARVADPSRGAPYLETLTTSIARAAWTLAQEIERNGGLWAALVAGDVQASVRAAAARTQAALADGSQVLTGVNLHRDPNPLLRRASLQLDAPLELPAPSCTAVPLSAHRWAEPFEAEQGGQS